MAETTTRERGSERKGLAHRLYTGDVSYDFIANRNRWYIVSGIVLAICLAAVLFRGLNLSIDFKGGTEFTVPVTVTSETVDEYRGVVQSLKLPDNDDITVNSVGTTQLRIQTRSLNSEEVTIVRKALAEKAGVPEADVTNNLIGASWGQQITEKGVIALVVFLMLVSLLIWAYFRDWKMAVAAIVALLHDLAVTVGIYALVGFSFSPASLIGMLTILGYSLYDTVVVFDKVRENVHELPKQNRTYSEAANKAINQVLVRSLNTTLIGVLPVAALLAAGWFILGVGPLKDLGLALFVGMIAGAYSSIFIATPLLAPMREAEPAQAEHRARLARRAARHGSKPAADDVPSKPTVVASTTGEVVDPTTVGVLTAEQLRDRQQPSRSTRAQRRK